MDSRPVAGTPGPDSTSGTFTRSSITPKPWPLRTSIHAFGASQESLRAIFFARSNLGTSP